MALPTQYTAGYTLYAGKVSCVCLAEWLPWLQRLCRAHGYIGKTSTLTILQLTGSYVLSGNNHSRGGVFDVKQYDRRIVALAREMGAPATWLRDMNFPDGSPGNTHMHGVLSGCPHNSPAAYQITAQKRGYDGMGQGWYGGSYLWGYGGKDPHPDPRVYRTFKQGIEWAQAEIVRLTGQAILDGVTAPTSTPPPLTFMERIMALSSTEQAEFNGAVAEALVYAMRYAPSVRAEIQKIVQQTVAGVVGYKNTDLSDRDVFAMVRGEAGTTLGQVAADVADTQAQVASLTSAVAALVALVQESHPKAEPAPEPATAYGVDVSGHQTLEQVKAAAADPVNGFVIVKATEGMTWRSDVYAAQVAAVRAAGKACGAYHFAWPNQDPIKEAANFLAGANLQPGDIAALDMERADAGETWATRVAYALAWCDEVAAKSGATPVVYVNWNWIKGMRTAATQEQWDRLVKYPLWLAEWTLVAGQHSTVTSKDGTNPDSWPVVIHQYGVVSNLDRNWTPDTARLAALAV